MSYTIPGEQAASELARTHQSTFALEISENETFILHLKLLPSQTISIINGASISLIINEPKRAPKSITFMMNDIEGAPFWITRKFTNEPEQQFGLAIPINLPNITHHILQAKQAQIALYDWNIRCLHSEKVVINLPIQTLDEWLSSLNSKQTHNLSDQQLFELGYSISFGGLQTPPSFWYMNTAYVDEVGSEPYVVSTNKYSDRISLSDYLTQGKHGYYQENALAIQLYKIFTVHSELFLSPRLTNATELTDFVLAYQDVIVLIESKATAPFDGTQRNAKSVERSLTNLVSKAFRQLDNAKAVITDDLDLIENLNLRNLCENANYIVSVCIVDDPFMINVKSLTKSLSEIEFIGSFPNPFVLSFEDLMGLITYTPSIEFFFEQLLDLAYKNLPEGSPPIFHLGFE